MNRDYGDYVSDFLYWNEFKRIGNTDLFKTKNYIFTEYHSLFATANCQTYSLLNDLWAGDELEFYLYLDMLTYLPFEKLGFDYLNKKLEKENMNVLEYKYNKINKLFNFYRKGLDDEQKDNVMTFLNNYYNDVLEINVIGLAIISLRLFHRFVTIMNFGGQLASMTIHKQIDAIFSQINNDVNINNLKEININDYLPKFDYSNELNEEMIEYLELCLEREKSPEGIRFIYNNLIYIDHPYKDYFRSMKIYNSNISYFYCHEYHRVEDSNISYLEYFVKELGLSSEVYFEAHFYEDYDSITYNPFGKAGYEYLKNNKKVLLNEIKFNKTMELLHKNRKKDELLTNEEISRIKQFYDNFYNDVFKLDAIGIASIYRRICVSLEEQIVLGNIKTKEESDEYVSKKINAILNDVKNNEFISIDVRKYLGNSEIKELDEKQMEYLEEVYNKIFM